MPQLTESTIEWWTDSVGASLVTTSSNSISDSRSVCTSKLLRIVNPVLEVGKCRGLLPLGRADGACLGRVMLLWFDTICVGGSCSIFPLTRGWSCPFNDSWFQSTRLLVPMSWTHAPYELLTRLYWEVESHPTCRVQGNKSSHLLCLRGP